MKMKMKMNLPYKTKFDNGEMAIIIAHLPEELDDEVFIGFTLAHDHDSHIGDTMTVIARRWYKDGKSCDHELDDITEEFIETVYALFRNVKKRGSKNFCYREWRKCRNCFSSCHRLNKCTSFSCIYDFR